MQHFIDKFWELPPQKGYIDASWESDIQKLSPSFVIDLEEGDEIKFQFLSPEELETLIAFAHTLPSDFIAMIDWTIHTACGNLYNGSPPASVNNVYTVYLIACKILKDIPDIRLFSAFRSHPQYSLWGGSFSRNDVYELLL